ncbi:PstS family phosphate ABC transporter substrate-binding protein [Leptolyngbya sp. FACHB-261]|uniref:PstS family phosphate ABC transporter substrate-binding protein n=1 Tax=Leptolyngbya sp. FACHB-261 TaxID=2692806 RepID=UPI0016889CCA|nr:PstS family phosphate ABC transporter substrate-binding protein [Leptolyngbya sp. FACHB-261]MBD2101285.1 PstS family phosphate ABC transporter substrate-binding protein [Leptolyngbya sp. FACHB-261]
MLSRFKPNRRTLFASLMVFSLAGVSACQGGSSQPGSDAGSSASPAAGASAGGEQVTGTVAVDGSSTVFPISQAIAEEFQGANPNAQVSVASSGTGGGMKKFCAGEIDVANASRPIKAEEIETCTQAGIEFVELPVALDGIAIVVNPQNQFATCLSVEELKKMWDTTATGKVTNWNQINPQFPSTPLKLYGPGTDSGTFEYFTEAINDKAKASRTDYTPSEDDNVLVQGVAGDPGALGYFGVAYFEENQDKLKLLQVKNPDTGECQAPVPLDNVVNGSYAPLSRPLFIYVSKKSLDEKPAVKSFVDFYLSNSKALVKDVGYVALPDEGYSKAQERVASSKTGSTFKDAKPGEDITEVLGREAAQ